MAKTPALHGYFGGKNRFESYISPVVPKDYKVYLEPFAGSFGVYFFLDMPNNAKVIFNDINKDQTNLVACSKDFITFHAYLKAQLEDSTSILYCKETEADAIKKHYRELYYSLKNSNFRNEYFDIPDMKRASIYAFLLTSAFSSCSYTAAGFSGFKLKTFLNKLQNVELQKKLAKINSFETLDFEESIKKYDSSDTFMYIDAPYYSLDNAGNDTAKRASWYGTKDEFGQDQHIKLLKLLPTLKSRWALSYYTFPILEELLPKDKFFWLEKEFFRSSASFSDNKEIKGNELLILNYDPKHIISNTPISEKLIDEIEETNEGAFIASEGNWTWLNLEKIRLLKDEAIKNKDFEKAAEFRFRERELISEFEEKEFMKVEPVKVEPVKDKDEDIDDFWNS